MVDEPTLAAFRTAMAPLDAHREANRRSSGSSAAGEGEGVEPEAVDAETEGVDIDEPLPPVPSSSD